MNKEQEIRMLLSEFGGEVNFERGDSIRVKKTPHSPETKLYHLTVDDIPVDELVQITIIQRLKWMLHKRNKNGSV